MWMDPVDQVKKDWNMRRWAVAIIGLAASSVVSAQTFETAKLVVPPEVDDILFQELLGDSVSAVDDMAWLGEPIDKVVKADEGSVFGFSREAGGWRLTEVPTCSSATRAAPGSRPRYSRPPTSRSIRAISAAPSPSARVTP